MKIKKQIIIAVASLVLFMLVASFFWGKYIKRSTDMFSENLITTQFLQYENKDYGFSFSLPDSWKGYAIIVDHWQGQMVDKSIEPMIPLTGPKILIRNSKWTQDTPRQDIPIMVFTIPQWNLIEAEQIAVGAAPILPSKLGQNKQYVFALPARYNFAFLPGFEEVDIIVKDNTPLLMNEIEILE